MALNIIAHNPYRILGAFPTSTRKEIVANIARIKANIRVNRTVSFPADLDFYLKSPDRTLETIANAESRLTLPAESIRYAQFWFVCTSELDTAAINALAEVAFEQAISIWEKKNDVSSTHNRVVAHLLRGDYEQALTLAYTFYTEHKEEFARLVLGSDSQVVSTENLGHDFLDVLCDEVGTSEILSHITNNDWREYVIGKTVATLFESLEHSITVAKQTREQDCNARLKAGTKLMTDTLPVLRKLKKEISPSNPKYQIIVDKLGLEILQCSIDYYNGSNDDDAAYKALKLQKYAQSVVVGKMAKDRCNENAAILEGIISKLPPQEVMLEHKAILSHIKTYATEPDQIRYSIKLIKDCAPYLISIKEKLGVDHTCYLQISTRIVNNALSNVISEVNAVQKCDFGTIKNVLIEAWRTQLYMDKFDLEQEYKEGRYKQSREALHDIIDQSHGFEDDHFSFMYKYGCGWCNNLDVSDLDLRTDDEHFSSCNDLESHNAYVKRFPSGKHVVEAKQRIEVLTYQNANTVEALNNFIKQFPQSPYVQRAKSRIIELKFKGCKSISDYKCFINDYPTSKFVPEAREAINKLIREEKERQIRTAEQERALAACQSTQDVLTLYTKERQNNIDASKCSQKAYDLAKTETEYRKVYDTFGTRTPGGQKAKSKIDEIEKRANRIKKLKSKIIKWALIILAFVGVIFGVYLIWGVEGLRTLCFIFVVVLGFIAYGGVGSGNVVGFVVGICSGVLAVVLGVVAGCHTDNGSDNHSTEYVQTDSTDAYSDSTTVESEPSQVDLDYETYIDNQLKTGAKPYKDYYRSRTGSNYLDFKTSGDDYVIIVRDYETSDVVNHIYVRADDRARLYLPNGTYNIYFYAGKGWNPNMDNGNVKGGFVSGGTIQKDGPVEIYNQYGEYTLYPVENGNLQLQSASEAEAL